MTNKDRNEVFVEMAPSNPILYDREKCIGCNRCVESCQVDCLVPGEAKGDTPRVLYPGECWYCGCCVMDCPEEGAIRLKHPLMNRVNWVEKEKLMENGRREAENKK